MWPRFHLADVKVVGHYLGVLVLLTGVAMVIPLLVAIFAQEYTSALDFLIGIGVCLCLGSALGLLRTRSGKLSRQQALFVVGFAWLIIAIVAAVPMYLSGSYASPLDALFDGVSSITTTGFSMNTDYNHMSVSQMVWRIMLVFVGGQGVIVVALSLGFFGRTGGAGSVYQAEAHNDHVLPNVINTARFIWAISGSVVIIGTLICTVICLLSGFNALDAFYNAFVLTISAYDTGGITPYSTSLVFYHSIPIELFCLVFTVMGIINFAVFAGIIKGNTKEFFKNIETRTVVIWLSVMTVCLTAVLAGDGVYTGLFELLRRGTFMAVSATTTAGFMTIYSSQMMVSYSGGAMVVLLIIMIVGGVSGSTAGGIKVARLGIIFKWFAVSVKRLLLPASAIEHSTYHQFQDRTLSAEVATQAMIIFILFSFTAVAGGMVGIVFGYEAIPAMFESVACVSSNGMGVGITSPTMPVALKIIYIIQMWAGRLEFVALLALIAGLVVSIVHGRSDNRARKAKR